MCTGAVDKAVAYDARKAGVDRKMIVDKTGAQLYGVFPAAKGAEAVVALRIGFFVVFIGAQVDAGADGARFWFFFFFFGAPGGWGRRRPPPRWRKYLRLFVPGYC